MVLCHTVICGYYYQGYCSNPFLKLDDKGCCSYFHFKRVFAPKDSHGLDVIDDSFKNKPIIIDAETADSTHPEAEASARVEAVNSA